MRALSQSGGGSEVGGQCGRAGNVLGGMGAATQMAPEGLGGVCEACVTKSVSARSFPAPGDARARVSRRPGTKTVYAWDTLFRQRLAAHEDQSP